VANIAISAAKYKKGYQILLSDQNKKLMAAAAKVKKSFLVHHGDDEAAFADFPALLSDCSSGTFYK